MDQLHVQTDKVRSYAQIHDQVAAGLSHALGAVMPAAAGAQTSHGPIAAAVSTALSSTLDSREDSLHATSASGATISELLQAAARRYERGDAEGAEKLTAAAEVLADGRRAAADDDAHSRGAADPPPASQAGAGAQMAGQMLGQVGQQVGQLVGLMAQPLAGIAQALQQIPQQIVPAVSDAAGSDKARLSGKDVSDRTKERADDDAAGSEPAEPSPTEPPAPGGASAGESASSGRAPNQPAPAEQPRPAQTRPQMD